MPAVYFHRRFRILHSESTLSLYTIWSPDSSQRAHYTTKRLPIYIYILVYRTMRVRANRLKEKGAGFTLYVNISNMCQCK